MAQTAVPPAAGPATPPHKLTVWLSVLALLVSAGSANVSCDASQRAARLARPSESITKAIFQGPAKPGELFYIDFTLKNFGQAVADQVHLRLDHDFQRFYFPPDDWLNFSVGNVSIGPGAEVVVRGRELGHWQPRKVGEALKSFTVVVNYRDAGTGQSTSFNENLASQVNLAEIRDGKPYTVELRAPVHLRIGIPLPPAPVLR